MSPWRRSSPISDPSRRGAAPSGPSTPERAWRSADGYALAAVIILLFVLGIVGMAYVGLATEETRASQSELETHRAFWLAEAGKEHAMNYLSRLFRPPEQDRQVYQDRSGPDGGSYSASVIVDTATVNEVQRVFMIESVGTFGNRERRIRQRVRMTSFSQYAYFTDAEQTPGGATIWFVTGDRVEGPMHTNGTLHILGSPRFLTEVTSNSDRMIGYPSYVVRGPGGWPVGGNDPRFYEGFSLDAARIDLPSRTLDIRGEALSGGLHLGPDSDVQLGFTGTTEAGTPTPGWLRYRRTGRPANTYVSIPISSLPNRVVYVEQEVQVWGVLDGELTIGSGKDIRIIDDVTYAGSDASGAPPPSCDDLLGLVAQRNILFADLPETYDLKVNAVLMALDTSIGAENYSTRPVSGTLTIWGGLIQKYRGPVGTIRNGVINHGYQKDYHYDTRVTARTPPAFPITGVYESIAWQESWDDAYPFR